MNDWMSEARENIARRRQEESNLMNVDNFFDENKFQPVPKPTMGDRAAMLGKQMAGGTLGIIGSLADAASTATGVGDGVGESIANVAEPLTTRGKQYNSSDILSNPGEYISDPNGLAASVGNMAGSMIGLMGAQKGLSMVTPAAISNTLTGATAALASRFATSAPWLARLISGETSTGLKFADELLKLKASTWGVEALSEGGSTARELKTEKGGNLSDYRAEAAKDVAVNAILLKFVDSLEAQGFGDFIKASGGKNAFMDTLAAGVKAFLGGGASNAFEEGEQTGFTQYAKGERGLWDVVNPVTWDEEQKTSALEGGITGGLFGAGGAVVGKTANNVFGNQQDIDNLIDETAQTSSNNNQISNNEQSQQSGTDAADAEFDNLETASTRERNAFINSLATQESDGNYDAVNERTGASGKYQIIPKNWPGWAQEAGLSADAEMTPENQDKVAQYKLGQYYDKYGAEGAAVAWYAGEQNAQRWVDGEPDAIGADGTHYSWDAKQGKGDEPSVREYVQQVAGRMGDMSGADNVIRMQKQRDEEMDNFIDATLQNYDDNYTAPQAEGIDVSTEIQADAEKQAKENEELKKPLGERQEAETADETESEWDEDTSGAGTPWQNRGEQQIGNKVINSQAKVDAYNSTLRDNANVRNLVDKLRAKREANNQRALDYAWLTAEHERNTGNNITNNTKDAIVEKALGDKKIDNITNRAINGDHGAQKAFSGMSANVKQALLNRKMDELEKENEIENAKPYADVPKEPFMPNAYYKDPQTYVRYRNAKENGTLKVGQYKPAEQPAGSVAKPVEQQKAEDSITTSRGQYKKRVAKHLDTITGDAEAQRKQYQALLDMNPFNKNGAVNKKYMTVNGAYANAKQEVNNKAASPERMRRAVESYFDAQYDAYKREPWFNNEEDKPSTEPPKSKIQTILDKARAKGFREETKIRKALAKIASDKGRMGRDGREESTRNAKEYAIEDMTQYLDGNGEVVPHYHPKKAKYWQELEKNIKNYVNDMIDGFKDIANITERKKAVYEAYMDNRKELENMLADTIEKLQEGMGNGVSILPNNKSDTIGAGIRASNNAPWYSKWYKEHGKPPTKAELEDIAYDILVNGGGEYVADAPYSPKYQPDYDSKREQLDWLRGIDAGLYDYWKECIAAEKAGIEKRRKEREASAKKNNNQNNQASADTTSENAGQAKQAEHEGAGQDGETEKIKLPEGYTTESGKPLEEAGEREYILDADGNADFGEITIGIEKATNGVMQAAPIRLQVGTKDFGLKHIAKHVSQMKAKGFENIMQFINHIMKNYNQIYDQRDENHPYRFAIYCLGDESKGFAPLDLELNKKTDTFYTIVSVMPHRKNIKGTLIYDESVTSSSATTNGKLPNGNNDKGGVVPANAAINSVPFATNSVAQNAENGNKPFQSNNIISDENIENSVKALSGGNIIPTQKQYPVAPIKSEYGKSIATYGPVDVYFFENSKQADEFLADRSNMNKLYITPNYEKISFALETNSPYKKTWAKRILGGLREAGYGKYADTIEKALMQGVEEDAQVIHDEQFSVNFASAGNNSLWGCISFYNEKRKFSQKAKPKKPKAETPVNRIFSDKEIATNNLLNALGLKRKAEEKAFNIVDDSDAALEAALKDARRELNKLSANPMFNPGLHKAMFKVGAIYLQRGANKFTAWAKQMVDALGEKARPWLGSVWKSIVAYPKEQQLNPEHMSVAVDFVGAQYEAGVHDGKAIYKAFADIVGEEEAKPFKGLIESAFAGIDELYNPTMQEENAGETSRNNFAETVETPAEEVVKSKQEEPQSPLLEEAQNLDVKFNLNQEQNGIEIRFNAAPSDEFRNVMKAQGGFKWNGKKHVWYAKQTPRAMKFAESIGYKAEEAADNGRTESNIDGRGNAGTRGNSEGVSEVQESAGGRTGKVLGVPAGQVASDKSGSRLAASASEHVQTVSQDGRADGESIRPAVQGERGQGEVFEHGLSATGRKGTSGVQSDAVDGRVGQLVRPVNENISTVNGNFHIDNPSALLGGSKEVRFSRNVVAIEKAQELIASGLKPTAEEQMIMASFTGWGSFAQEVFGGTYDNPEPKAGWEEQAQWLHDNMSKEEWEDARDSTTNAFFTDPITVSTMWNMIRKMGFKGGRVLEPSMGVGNFFGLMPKDMAERSKLAGIELDSLTGKMAQMLYPNANIQIKGYQDSKTPNDFYDLIVGNVPFTGAAPSDRRYNSIAKAIHEFFFLKGIDQVRPGGLMVAITTHGTLDRIGKNTRLELARKAELVAAYRMPTGSFKNYAGTDVVADILVFQKKDAPSNEGILKLPWLNSNPAKEGADGVNINDYFVEHPENVLGEASLKKRGDRGENSYELQVKRPADYEDKLTNIVNSIPENIYKEKADKAEIHYISNNTTDLQNSIVEQGGKLYAVYGDYLKPLREVKAYSVKKESAVKAFEEKLKALYNMRKILGNLMDADRAGDANAEQYRKELNKAYDAYVKENGTLLKLDKNGKEAYADNAIRYMNTIDDPYANALAALERKDKNGNFQKADIFKHSTVRVTTKLENPTIEQAFIAARNNNVNLDVDKIASDAHVSRKEVEKKLIDDNLAYKTPSGNYVVNDVYLSGDVREKLREAQEALAHGDKSMQRNVDALKKVLPPTVPYYNIETNVGATWINADYYKQFIAKLLNVPYENLQNEDIVLEQSGAGWNVKLSSRLKDTSNAQNLFSVNPRYGIENVLNNAFNHTSPKLSEQNPYTGETMFSERLTNKAIEKIEKVYDDFGEWIWADNSRKIDLENTYNETMNSIAIPKYDGSFMEMPGMALQRGDSKFNLRKHQMDAIYRGVVNGSGIYAHEVGTGKTYTMAGLALESRRLGLAKKPMLLAFNANSKSVADDVKQMYPNAKVLYIDNLDKNSIARKLNQIKTDDWDLVVIPHSQVEKLGFKRETLEELAAEQIAALEEAAIEAAKSDGQKLTSEMMDKELEAAIANKGKPRKQWVKSGVFIKSQTVKQLVKQRNEIKETIMKQADNTTSDKAVSFEDLGVDMLIVDEAHAFKKPPIESKMNMKGLQLGASNAGIKLSFLTKYVQSLNDGKGVHLFTGTPITNTMTELFNMMRYVMPNELKQAGLNSFDAWFNVFASEVSDVEITSTGEYAPVKRLAAFTNVAELRRMAGQYLDIVFADDMPEFKPRETESGKTLSDKDLTDAEKDELLNGRSEDPQGRPYKKTINEVIPLNDTQASILDEIIEKIKNIKKLKGKARKEWLKKHPRDNPVVLDGEANRAGMDARLYGKFDPNAEADPNSKVTRVVKNVTEIYNSDPRAVQAIFMDTGLSGKKSVTEVNEAGEKVKSEQPTLNVAKDIIKHLVANGIPEKEIVIMDSDNPTVRAEIAKKLNNCEYRVVIGSTARMGVGVNMQENLRAMHHLDAPWMPGDLEQRNGRGHRQGNKWNTVLEYRYITEKMDGKRWQVLTVKQKFINAFLKAEDNIRTIEGDAVDMSDGEENGGFAETLAAATGDPRQLIKNKLEADVKKLEKKERTFVQGLQDNAAKIKNLQELSIPSLKNSLEHLTADSELFKKNTADKDFTIDLVKSYAVEANPRERVNFTSHKEANAHIEKIRRNLMGNQERVLGEYAGFKLSLRKVISETRGSVYNIIIEAPSGERYQANADNMASMTATLRNLPGRIEKMQAELDSAYNSIDTLKQTLDQTFPSADKLEAKRKMLADIKQDLQESPVPPPAWLMQGAPADSDVYVDGKRYNVTGHKANTEGYYVVGESYENGEKEVIPYQKTTDAQGMELFDVNEHGETPAYKPPKKGEGLSAEAEDAEYTDDNQKFSATADNDAIINRDFEELAESTKKALHATNVEREGNVLVATLPNGKKVAVDIQDQIIVNKEQRAAANKAHGYKAGDASVIEGHWQEVSSDDIVGVITLSKLTRMGNELHEVMHMAMELFCTDKENAALLKHYAKDAKESGRLVIEEIADGYKNWMLARAQRKGTIFGKLFNKMLDGLQKLADILGVNEKGRIFRDIESGKMFEREARNSNGDAKYLVTNGQITSETLVPVVDITGLPMVDVNRNQQKAAVAKSLIGKEFRIIGSNGIGRVASMNDGKHLVNSSDHTKRSDADRKQALSAAEEILNNCIYVDKHIDRRHNSGKDYIELFAAARSGNTLTRFRIVAKEGDITAGKYEVKEAKFYDIIKERTSRVNIPQKGIQRVNVPSAISVAELLAGVKDNGGKGQPYINANGSLNFEPDVQRYSTHQSKEDKAYFKAIEDGNMGAVSAMVTLKARENGFTNAIPEQTNAYVVRTKAAPKKTIKVYKLFTVAPDGRPTALFVAGTEKLPQGVWLDAVDTWHFTGVNGQEYIPSTQNPYTKGGKTGGMQEIPNEEVRQELIKRGYLKEGSRTNKITALAYRPGWHAGTMPFFPQGGMKPPKGMKANYENIHRYNQVVFECELAADTDYTKIAENQPKARKKDGTLNTRKADLQYMPEDGYYYYATNPMTHGHPELGMWAISGSLKIGRALTQEECDRILTEQGLKPQEWEGGEMSLEKLGYTGEEDDIARKTLAPITRDDEGNIIPLSARFNPNVHDIRYSVAPVQQQKKTPPTHQQLRKIAEKIVGKIYTGRAIRNQSDMYNHRAKVGIMSTQGDPSQLASIVGLAVDAEKHILHGNEMIKEMRDGSEAMWAKVDLDAWKNMGANKQIKEGIAQFMRLYTADKAEAQKAYPKYFAEFEKALANDAKLKANIEELAQGFKAWREASPAAKAYASIARKGKQPIKSMADLKQRIKDGWETLYTTWMDDKNPLNVAMRTMEVITGQKIEKEADPYVLARMAQSSIAARVKMFVDGSGAKPGSDKHKAWIKALKETFGDAWINDVSFQDIVSKVAEFSNLAKTDKMAQAYLADNGFESGMDALKSYLIANRSMEIWEKSPDYVAPISKEEAQQIVLNAPQKIKDAAQLYYDYDSKLLAILHSAGMVNDKAYETMQKYTRYCPMFRDFSDEKEFDSIVTKFSSMNSYVNLNNGIKKLSETGSAREVVDPIEAMLKMTTSVIGRAEKNKVGQAFVKTAERSGIGKFIIPEMEVTGKPRTTADPSQNIFVVWQDGEKRAYRTTSDIYEVLQGDTGLSKAINHIMDNMAMRTAGKAAGLLRKGATSSPWFMLGNVMRDTAEAGFNSENGFIPVIDTIRGIHALMTDADFAAKFEAAGVGMASIYRQDEQGLNDKVKELQSGKTMLQKLWQWYEHIGELAENGTRAGEFKLALKNGKSVVEAAINAKDVTLDFSRAGTAGRAANKVIPFFNAVVQGGDIAARTLYNHPTKAFTWGAAMALGTALLWAMNSDEPWYEELSRDEKMRAFHFSLGDGKHFSIPKPNLYGYLFGSSIEATLEYMNGKDKKMMKEWAKNVVTENIPSILPTIIKPLIEVYANKDFYFDSPIVSSRYEKLPAAEQINSVTSWPAKQTGRLLDVSPIKIDHIIRGYTGSAGKWVATLMTTMLEDSNAPAKNMFEQIGADRFVKRDFQHPKSVDDWYELKEELTNNHNAYDPKSSKPAYVAGANKIHAEINKINKTIRTIKDSTNYTPEQKTKMLDNAQQKLISTAQRGLKMYSKYAEDDFVERQKARAGK